MDGRRQLMVRPSPKWWSLQLTDRSDVTVPSPNPSTRLGKWACGSTWRRHTSKCGSSAPHQRITRPTSRPLVASPTWSSTEQVARPATKRFHPSDWRALEACCRPWTLWCNDATALAGYATMMTMLRAGEGASPSSNPVANTQPNQWRGERYDGTSTRTGPLQSKKLKNRIER